VTLDVDGTHLAAAIDADTELPQSSTGWRWNASSKTLDIIHGDDPVVIRF
jgi:hypothetical protein